MSHAAGLSGTPFTGQFSSAATSASCASSSARPTSRTMRATLAMIFADSMRQTASIARRVVASPVMPAVRPRVTGLAVACALQGRVAPGASGKQAACAAGSAPKSASSCTCRTSITWPSPAGQRDAHSMASSRDLTASIQYPPTTSLASANGPSTTRGAAAGERHPRAHDRRMQPVAAPAARRPGARRRCTSASPRSPPAAASRRPVPARSRAGS